MAEELLVWLFMLLLISEGLHPQFFFPRRSYLIDLPLIFLEHGALPDIGARYASLPKIEACFVTLPFPPPFGCFWEHPWATHWELGNILQKTFRTWEHDVKTKKINPILAPPTPPIGKKDELSWVYAKCLIGCMHILFLAMVIAIFLPRLMPLL
jgi:hypothetical protein